MARSGTLDPAEQREYRSRRAELARALLAAPSLTRQPGQSARHSLRVARALQVEISGAGRPEKLTTFDISAERLDLAILDMVLQQLGPVRPPPAH